MVWECDLVSEEFTKKCSKECSKEIQELIEFQKLLSLRMAEIKKCIFTLIAARDRIHTTCAALNWNWSMLNYFYKKLKALKGEECTAEKSAWAKKFKETALGVSRLLVGAGISYPIHNEYELKDKGPNEVEEFRTVCVSQVVNYGRFLYKNTKSEQRANELFKSIEDIENGRDLLSKKHDESKEEAIDLSEEDMRKQIEFTQQLPSVEVVKEIQELLEEVNPLHWCNFKEYKVMAMNIMSDIEATSLSMITTRIASGIGENLHKGEIRGVKETIDSLLEKVNMFKKRWEDVYGRYFGSFDPQQTE